MLHTFFVKVATVALTGILTFGSWLGITPTSPQVHVGAAIPGIVALFETSLASKITSSATSMTLVSGTTKDGTTLTGDFGFIIDEGSANEEFVRGTASGTSVTGLVRGVSTVDASSTIASLQHEHRRGASVKVTNFPSQGVLTRILNGQESLPHVIAYDGSITNALISATGTNLVDYNLLASTSIAGAANASFTLNGIVQSATLSQLIQGTSLGSTGAFLFAPNRYFNATSSATTSVPVANFLQGTNYVLSPTYIPTSTVYNWTGTHTFTSSTIFTASSSFTGATAPQISTQCTAGNDACNYTAVQTAVAASAGEKILIYSSSTTATTTNSIIAEIASTTIAANFFGTSNGIEADIWLKSFTIPSTGACGGGTFSWWLRYGTTDFATTTAGNINQTYSPAHFSIYMIASSSAQAQQTVVRFEAASSTPNAQWNFPQISTGVSTVDSTASKTLSLYMQETAGCTATAVTQFSTWKKIR